MRCFGMICAKQKVVVPPTLAQYIYLLLSCFSLCLAALHIEGGEAYDLCSDPAITANTTSTHDEYNGKECNFSNSFVARLPRSTDLSISKLVTVRFDGIRMENVSAYIGMTLEYSSADEIYRFAPLRVTVANSTFVNAGLRVKGHQPKGSTLLVINNTFTRALAESIPSAILWFEEDSLFATMCVDSDVRIEANALLVNISITNYAVHVFHVMAKGRSLFFGAGQCDFINNEILFLESFRIAAAPICTIFVESESHDLTIGGPVTIARNSVSFKSLSAAVATLEAAVSVALVSAACDISLADFATLALRDNVVSGAYLSFSGIVRIAVVTANTLGEVFLDKNVLTLFDKSNLEISGNRAFLEQSSLHYSGPQPTIVAAEVIGLSQLHPFTTLTISNNTIELKGVTIATSTVVVDISGDSMLLAGAVRLCNNSFLAIGVTALDSAGTRFVASKIVATGAQGMKLERLVEVSHNALILVDSDVGVQFLCAAFIGRDAPSNNPMQLTADSATLIITNNSIALVGGRCNATVATVLVRGSTFSLSASSHVAVVNNTLTFSSNVSTHTRVGSPFNSGWHFVVNIAVETSFALELHAEMRTSGNMLHIAKGCVLRSRAVVVAQVDIGGTMQLGREARFIAEGNHFEAGPLHVPVMTLSPPTTAATITTSAV